MALAGRGFLAWYNARLTSHPYSVKAFGTGATYVASDCTAQAIEGENVKACRTAPRALKFGAVGCFWVGPLLTYWFNVMERFLPGRAPARVAAKLVIDQVLQGPFMIGSMFALCAAANGASHGSNTKQVGKGALADLGQLRHRLGVRCRSGSRCSCPSSIGWPWRTACPTSGTRTCP